MLITRTISLDPKWPRCVSIYRTGNGWAFDDLLMHVSREPFVKGMSEMLDVLVEQSGLEEHIGLFFKDEPFNNYEAELSLVREEDGGAWYEWEDMDMAGWLCPMLYAYFDCTPEKLYFAIGKSKRVYLSEQE